MSNERAGWLKDIEVAQTMTTQKMSGTYLCPELSMPAVRVGADDHNSHPSRRGKYLYFKDGRVSPVEPT